MEGAPLQPMPVLQRKLDRLSITARRTRLDLEQAFLDLSPGDATEAHAKLRDLDERRAFIHSQIVFGLATTDSHVGAQS